MDFANQQHELLSALESYLATLAHYHWKMKDLMEPIESILPDGNMHLNTLRNYISAFDRAWQAMPKTLHEVMKKSKAKSSLDRKYGDAWKYVPAFYNYYGSVVKSLLLKLELEGLDLLIMIRERGLQHDRVLMRDLEMARQMVKDMMYRLEVAGNDVPLFNEVWIGVTECHDEMKSLWRRIGVERPVTHLEKYVGFQINESWFEPTPGWYLAEPRGTDPDYSIDDLLISTDDLLIGS